MGLYNSLHPVSDTNGSPDSGSGSAVSVDAECRSQVEVFYNVGGSGDALKIEGSVDGTNWRELDATVASGSITTGGDTVKFTTGYRHVRAYGGSSFSDSNVNTLEITAKGP